MVDVFLFLFLVTIILVSILGNVLVVIAVGTDQRLRKLSNLFLVRISLGGARQMSFFVCYLKMREEFSLRFRFKNFMNFLKLKESAVTSQQIAFMPLCFHRFEGPL